MQTSFRDKYHELNKTTICENQVKLKAFWQKIHDELTCADKEVVEGGVDEIKMKNLLSNEMHCTSAATEVSREATLVMSRACEIFTLELAMRAWQSASDQCEIKEEDVLRAMMTSEVHDLYIP